jgi:uncharacterized protein (TIGR00251 family)
MISAHAQGVVLAVRAQPGARKRGVTGQHNGMLKLAVQAPPDKGRANEALVELIAELFECKRSQVELLSGQTSQEKKFLLRGMSVEEAEAKLSALLTQ